MSVVGVDVLDDHASGLCVRAGLGNARSTSQNVRLVRLLCSIPCVIIVGSESSGRPPPTVSSERRFEPALASSGCSSDAMGRRPLPEVSQKSTAEPMRT